MAINEKVIKELICQITMLTQSVADIKTAQTEPLKPIYDNAGLKKLLGIGGDLIKKYRDNGNIGYTKIGDKYWYTADDILSFMKKSHYKPFGRNVHQ